MKKITVWNPENNNMFYFEDRIFKYLNKFCVIRMSSPTLVQTTKESQADDEFAVQNSAKNGPRKSVSIVLPEEDKGWLYSYATDQV